VPFFLIIPQLACEGMLWVIARALLALGEFLVAFLAWQQFRVFLEKFFKLFFQIFVKNDISNLY